MTPALWMLVVYSLNSHVAPYKAAHRYPTLESCRFDAGISQNDWRETWTICRPVKVKS